MILARFLWMTHDTMPRVNALKNVVLGLANVVLAPAYGVLGALAYFAQEPDMESLMIDSTIVRAHPCAAGAEKKR